MEKKLKSLLMLIKVDANNVFDRISSRQAEYVSEFSLKRTRDHFNNIFRNRFEGLSIEAMVGLDPEIIVAADNFYQELDRLHWYLMHTQDMTNTVEDNVGISVKLLKKNLDLLLLYTDQEVLSDQIEEGDLENLEIEDMSIE
ncbi:hypothetical protein OAB57_00865 [Bacteriovoracaceae bacterium]|nr:hypothetical protein [Bacteriovoracaceae bacterium]